MLADASRDADTWRQKAPKSGLVMGGLGQVNSGAGGRDAEPSLWAGIPDADAPGTWTYAYSSRGV